MRRQPQPHGRSGHPAAEAAARKDEPIGREPHRSAVYTIGHSNRPLDEFVQLLRAHGLVYVADVRTIPRSRRNPQFGRETLPAELAAADIQYRHFPELGGLRRPRPDSPNTAWRNASFRGYADYMQTASFSRGLQALLDLAGSSSGLVLMCAEAVPWRCHRSLIADALTVRGVPVQHVIGAGAARPHVLTPWARVEGVVLTYPSAESD